MLKIFHLKNVNDLVIYGERVPIQYISEPTENKFSSLWNYKQMLLKDWEFCPIFLQRFLAKSKITPAFMLLFKNL